MTMHLARQGHLCISDGQVLRLDLELGRYVARHFSAELSLQRCAIGSLEDMRALVNLWADELEDACVCRRPVA